MRWSDAHATVEAVRRQTQLWLPALSLRRGFSATRTEHLLNGLVAAMPADELYLEVGSLEGRTLESAAHGNDTKHLVACDPGAKYQSVVAGMPLNVEFHAAGWETVLPDLTKPVGCCFYDADHSADATGDFLHAVTPRLADEAVVVLDDWDRVSVRDGAFAAMAADPRWQVLREMPEYGDGLTCPPNHFGHFFGCAVLGWKR